MKSSPSESESSAGVALAVAADTLAVRDSGAILGTVVGSLGSFGLGCAILNRSMHKISIVIFF